MWRVTITLWTALAIVDAGCTCTVSDEPPDTPIDSGRVDTGVDALDAPIDAGRVDTGVDAFDASLDAPDARRDDVPPLEPSCDPDRVLCESLPPACEDGEAPSVVGSCWGECIPVRECRCRSTDDCPDIRGYSEVCYTAGHCGPLL